MEDSLFMCFPALYLAGNFTCLANRGDKNGFIVVILHRIIRHYERVKRARQSYVWIGLLRIPIGILAMTLEILYQLFCRRNAGTYKTSSLNLALNSPFIC